eukprot:scaffold125991_cov57-Phaeocystis_antarctica.AAC.2
MAARARGPSVARVCSSEPRSCAARLTSMACMAGQHRARAARRRWSEELPWQACTQPTTLSIASNPSDTRMRLSVRTEHDTVPHSLATTVTALHVHSNRLSGI